ncbi:MAG: trehalose-6-phosphate synthase [Gaiellaceae bacterium]
MDKRRSIIVVSNRGPVTYHRGPDATREARRGGGGLVTALASLAAHHNVTWIASAMTEEDREIAIENGREGVQEETRNGVTYRLRLIAHERPAFDWYYNVVANPTLWFVQHYLWDFVRAPNHDRGGLEHAWEKGYVPVNAVFADTVLDELSRQPDAIIFFHDYHLYLAPRYVRTQAPEASLLHFVHIPWTQSDYWHVLPAEIRVAIHDGLLANDMVGFHTGRWQRNFLHSAEEVLGAEIGPDGSSISYAGWRTQTSAHPISVDSSEFDELCAHPRVLEHERRIVETRPEFLVVRVDRTDPSKNIIRGFEAFELFLDLHPELHGRVAMLALLDPSRQNIPEYAEYLGAIQRAARCVNEHFQCPGWTPIDLQIHDDFHQSVAAYKQYDALLVNAIYDGLNLVAKEAPLVNGRDGVLILSENTGAFEELGPYSLAINPFDINAQANAIYDALVMASGERKRRLAAIRARVREHDLAWWLGAQLADLDMCIAARAEQSGSRSPLTDLRKER